MLQTFRLKMQPGKKLSTTNTDEVEFVAVDRHNAKADVAQALRIREHLSPANFGKAGAWTLCCKVNTRWKVILRAQRRNGAR